MSVHVLLNLLNELGESDEMQGWQRILSLTAIMLFIKIINCLCLYCNNISPGQTSCVCFHAKSILVCIKIYAADVICKRTI